MNNDEALAILTTKRTAVNSAINNLNKYVQGNGQLEGIGLDRSDGCDQGQCRHSRSGHSSLGRHACAGAC